MEEEFPILNFAKTKPIKCAHCQLKKGDHKAQTYQCPAKWSKGRAVGYTHYEQTVYTPKSPTPTSKGGE